MALSLNETQSHGVRSRPVLDWHRRLARCVFFFIESLRFQRSTPG